MIRDCQKCGGTHYGSNACPYDDDSPNVKDHQDATGMIVPSKDMIASSELSSGFDIERLMGELVDRLAACPGALIDPRVWEQLRIYAPYGLRKRPVAFRVKCFQEGWRIFHDEQKAVDCSERNNGALMQGLYVRDGK